jgi:hypothetical protein
VADDSAAFGWRYASRTVLAADAAAAPFAMPSAHIAVRDVLP